MIFVNYKVIDHKLLNKIIGNSEKITKSGHFAPAYLGSNNKLRASLEVSLWVEHYLEITIDER